MNTSRLIQKTIAYFEENGVKLEEAPTLYLARTSPIGTLILDIKLLDRSYSKKASRICWGIIDSHTSYRKYAHTVPALKRIVLLLERKHITDTLQVKKGLINKEYETINDLIHQWNDDAKKICLKT